MNRAWLTILLIGFVLLCEGCSSMVTIEAKGKRNGEATIPSHVTYAVFPTGEVEKDSAFPTYARLVAKKMDEQGFKESDAKTARLAVYVGYGVTESSSGVRSSAPAPRAGQSGGMSPGGMATGGEGYGGGGYGGGVTSQTSSLGKQYVSQLVVVVGDLPQSRAAGSLVELWRGETLHRSSTNDLPTVAPLLVDASFQHFGETTPSSVTHSFGEEEVKRVRERQSIK